jgi:hypothetical protein
MDTNAESAPSSPSDRAAALARAAVGTLQVARALAQSRRSIDLAGLDQEIGRLCAASLDLPAAQGRAMRPLLFSVLAELDALSACMVAQSEDGA